MIRIFKKSALSDGSNGFSHSKSFFKWLGWSVIFAVLISLYAMYRIHYVYWGDENRTSLDQGTIFAVQTVEFNIASASFPAKLSFLLSSSQPKTEEIQQLLQSAYGLLSFVVTDCIKPIGEECEDEKILHHTRTWWLDDLIENEDFKQSDFDLLRQAIPIYQEYQYESPKDHRRIALLTPDHEQLKDTVIGRIYYVRHQPPPFQNQLNYWFKKGLFPTSTDAKYYSPVLIRFLCVAVIVSLLLWRYDYKLHQSNLKNIAEEHKKLEVETQLRKEQEKLKDAEIQHRLQLEDLMAMFAHKFRGPLDSLDFNFRNGCLDPSRFLRSLETMRGLLDTFSAISTNSDDFVKKVRSDTVGSQSPIDVLRYSLEFVIGHLTTRNKISAIHQHYLRYAKNQGLVDDELDPRTWIKNYASKEIELQQIFSEAFFGYEQNKDNGDILSLTENLFFTLEVRGFDSLDIHFKPFEHKSSFLTIILSEILTNALKYYSSKTMQEVVLTWIEKNESVIIRCITPSSKIERRQSKGSGKGHFFLNRLTEMLGGTFSFQYPEHDSLPCITEINLPRNLFYQD